MRLLSPSLTVFDNDPCRTTPFVDGGATAALDLVMIAHRCDVIFACLPTSAVTEAVLFGAVFVSHSLARLPSCSGLPAILISPHE